MTVSAAKRSALDETHGPQLATTTHSHNGVPRLGCGMCRIGGGTNCGNYSRLLASGDRCENSDPPLDGVQPAHAIPTRAKHFR